MKRQVDSLLYIAHRAIESVTLDKETMHAKEKIMPEYAELVYNDIGFQKKIKSSKDNRQKKSIKFLVM